MRRTLTALLLPILLWPASGISQQLAFGLETGFYAMTTDKVGPATLDKASGLTLGLTTSYYPSERLALNTGFSSTTLDIWGGAKLYSVPLSASYSLSRRGMLHAKEKHPRSFGELATYLLTLGFIPQTLEVEGGIALGFYDGSYSHSYLQSGVIYGSGNQPEMYSYRLTQKNTPFVPSLNVGFRWTFDFKQLHLSIRPRYSLLLVRDNRVVMEDLLTGRVTRGGSQTGFSMLAALFYTF